MEMYLEIFLSFFAGIISTPFLIEGFGIYRQHQLQNKYLAQLETNDQLHLSRMNDLVKQYNHAAKKHNLKLERIRKKLAGRNIEVENENRREIVIKRIPVQLPFLTWLKQRRW